MLNNILSGIQSVEFLHQEFIWIMFARCIFSMSRGPALCCHLSVMHLHISVYVKNHNLYYYLFSVVFIQYLQVIQIYMHVYHMIKIITYLSSS